MNDRVIATCHDYDEMIRAFRVRVAEFNVRGEAIDDLACMPDRYFMKLLAPNPVKQFGRLSLGAYLGALALKILVVEDTERLSKIRAKLESARSSGSVLPAVGKSKRKRFSIFKGNPELARALRASQILAQSPEKRKQIARNAKMSGQTAEQRSANARKAVQARWAKYREDRRAA